MKSFIFSLLFTYLCVAFAQEEDVSFYTAQEEQLLDICSAEYNTYINKTEFKLSGSLQNESNHNAKCLFFCVPKKLSITDDTGVIDAAQIKDLITSRYPTLSDSIVKAVIKKCTRRLSLDVCDRWYRLTKCIWKIYLNGKKAREAHDRRSKLTSKLSQE